MPKDDKTAAVPDGDGTSAFESMISGDAPEGSAGTDMALPEDEERVAVATDWTQTPEFEANEVGFPKLRLGQGLTPEVAEGTAKMGNWLLTGQDPFTEGVVVVPIMFGRTRWKRKDPTDRDSPIVCTSADARVGKGDPGGDCKKCPFAKWTPGGANGKNKPPVCTLTYKYAVFVDGADTVAEIVFQKTSETYAHLINNMVQRYGFGKFAVRLTSTIKRGNNRMWAEPQITLTKLTPDLQANVAQFIPGAEVEQDWGIPDDAEVFDGEAVPV